MRLRVPVLLALLASACSPAAKPAPSDSLAVVDSTSAVPIAPRAVAARRLSLAPVGPFASLRCILHSDTLSARVDSCTVAQGAPPAPPAPAPPPPPPAPAPAPPPPPPAPAPAPPPPPPSGDTVIVSVKVGPNPVTIAAGSSYQLVGGAYNKSGALVPNAGLWFSDNAGVVSVDQHGKITGVAAGTNVNVEFQYKTKGAWSTITVTGSAPSPTPTPVPPTTSSTLAPADSFVRSVGVGTHFPYYDLAPYSPGSAAAQRVAQIKALGVGFIRDGVAYDPNDQNRNAILTASLGALGPVKLILVTQPSQNGSGYLPPYNQLAAIDTAVAQIGASNILALEGPNEVDNNNGAWGGIPAYGKNTATFQCAMYAHFHARGITVISPTVTSAFGASNMPDLTSCADAATLHPYPGGVLPMSSFANTKSFTQSFVKGKPFWVTETGYYTLPNATQNAYQPGVSELAAAKYIARGFLDYFAAGVPHSSTYELIDEHASTTDAEANYGLLRNNGSAKPSYTALQTMLKSLADPGASFTPKSFTYKLTGATPTVRALGLAKRDGRVELLLWNDVLVYDVNAKKDIANAVVPVQVTLSITPKSISVSYPVTAPASVAISAASTFSVGVSDSPVIVEITP